MASPDQAKASLCTSNPQPLERVLIWRRSIVIENALRAFREKEAPGPVYFYCTRNSSEPGRSDPARIIASLARQLAKPQGAKVLTPTKRLYEEYEDEGFAEQQLTQSESEKLVLQLLGEYKASTAILVLDALDECDRATRGGLLAALERFLKEAPCLLKIFVSSRDDQDLVCRLQSYPTLELSSDRNAADIRAFIRCELDRRIESQELLRGSPRKDELRNQISTKLEANAHGLYVSPSRPPRISLIGRGSVGAACR